MSDAGNIVAAFAPEHVVRLTGLSMRQLAYWDQTGFFRPQHLSEGRGPYGRVY
jgi:DNA-binding transcriptional MerR regulator